MLWIFSDFQRMAWIFHKFSKSKLVIIVCGWHTFGTLSCRRQVLDGNSDCQVRLGTTRTTPRACHTPLSRVFWARSCQFVAKGVFASIIYYIVQVSSWCHPCEYEEKIMRINEPSKVPCRCHNSQVILGGLLGSTLYSCLLRGVGSILLRVKFFFFGSFKCNTAQLFLFSLASSPTN